VVKKRRRELTGSPESHFEHCGRQWGGNCAKDEESCVCLCEIGESGLICTGPAHWKFESDKDL
jgi:hypothetical protein